MGIPMWDPYMADMRRQPSQESVRELIPLAPTERSDEELAEWFARKLVEWPKR